MSSAIPFNRAFLTGKELTYIREAVAAGHISGDGAFTRKCQAILQDAIGCGQALLTTSCTDALEMAALLLDWSSDTLLNQVAVTSNHDASIDTLGGGLGLDTASKGTGDGGDWEKSII